MDLGTLKKLRVIVPFFIVSGCLVPWFLLTQHDHLIIPILAWTVTFFYVGLNFRDWYWQEELHTHIAPQIREALFELIPGDLGVSESERNALSQRKLSGRLTGIFWEAVDRDEMLTAQKPHFYANGIVYTTSIDVYMICSVAAAAYAIGALVAGDYQFLIVGIVLLLVAFCSELFVIPRARQHHLELSAEQLELLQRKQSDYVKQRFREIILETRRSARGPN